MALAGFALAPALSATAEDAEHIHMAPVTNPLFFEDPHITSEVRPIFIYHKIDDTFISGGGFARVYAAQLRYAINDRLGFIATKDGFTQLRPTSVLPHKDGWNDLSAGLKYAVIDDKENDLIVTPGFKIAIPTGNERVFQGSGKGEWDVFISAQKGYDKVHFTGNAGARIPNDFHDQTAQLHYSAQVDYATCKYFVPFVAMSAFTTLNNANQLALGHEGYDVYNFGVSNGAGKTSAVLGGGFRSRVIDRVDLGFAYERGVTHPQGLFDSRFTVDLIFRF
ncbi:MAG TPA: hypothetical protein DCM86_12545 [Verrucomicrobiales bacterium]|nr:hypothetical protein [Verrucomicrobiales bacterium]